MALNKLQENQSVVGLSEKSLVIDHLKGIVTNKSKLDPIELAARINDRIEGEGRDGFLLGLKEKSKGLYDSIMQVFAAERVLSKQLAAQNQKSNTIAPPRPGFGPGSHGSFGDTDE
jgi:hypothetical protein